MADIAEHARVYVTLALSALTCACVVGLALGLLAAHARGLRTPVLTAANIARVLPSLAVLTFMLPLFGIGFAPAFFALTLLASAPIAITTDVAFRALPAAVLDAADGMGFTRAQRLLRVEWPLALPVVFSGIRTAATEVVASAVIAAFVGAGGLGEYITTGLQANDPHILWTGVLAIALIAIAFEAALALIQSRIGELA
jgi:osmoprotectant transport system permease protein